MVTHEEYRGKGFAGECLEFARQIAEKENCYKMMLYPLMEAVRSDGDLENLGGDGKYSKTVVCPDGCVIFKLTARPLGNTNFHKGGFWDYPDSTEQENK